LTIASLPFRYPMSVAMPLFSGSFMRPLIAEPFPPYL